jgi:hemoglobin-like flavoprotein
MDFEKLSKEDIKLIQLSFKQLSGRYDKAGEVFYKRLFEIDPNISKLFKGNIKEQSSAMMRMVKTVVEGLNYPEVIIPAVQDLGRRHHEYGVAENQYKMFGDCLIECLAQEVGKEFNEKTKAAWYKLYEILADVMRGKHYEE